MSHETIISTITVLAMARRNAEGYEARGYRFEATDDPAKPKAIVVGDVGQFYCDAVADDAGASWAMEMIRRTNSDEYERYRSEAKEDFIDLDDSQDVFMRAARRRLDEKARHKAAKR